MPPRKISSKTSYLFLGFRSICFSFNMSISGINSVPSFFCFSHSENEFTSISAVLPAKVSDAFSRISCVFEPVRIYIKEIFIPSFTHFNFASSIFILISSIRLGTFCISSIITGVLCASKKSAGSSVASIRSLLLSSETYS